MSISSINIFDQEQESLSELLKIMHSNPKFKIKVITLLKLDPWERQSILDYWLEQMQRQQSCEELRSALACLVDEKVSSEMLEKLSN